MINTFTIGLRALRRDWRAGEIRILAIAVVIAVASVTSVGFFTDRVRQAMGQQASELLAADLVVESSWEINPAWSTRARESGLVTATTLSFRSVVVAEDKTQLAEVKAVAAGYPLRGRLEVSDAPFVAGSVTSAIPKAGEVWADSRLLQALKVRVGDAIGIGASTLTLTRVLTYEPDRGGDFFSIAPRALMSLGDVPATQLIQPGSRVRYKLLVAGASEKISDFRRWLEPRLSANDRLVTLEEGRPEMRAALERADRFLGLAALVSVFLAGVAVAMAARRFAQRHLDTTAIMRCFGASQMVIVQVFTWQVLALGLIASLAGAVVGYGAQELLARLLSGLLPGPLPAPSLSPALQGLLTGLTVLVGFALPPLLALRGVSPLRVLRRDLGPMPARTLGSYALALAAMVLLMAWQAGDGRLLAYVLVGAVATVLTLVLAARALVGALSGLRQRVGVAWRFGFASIARRARASVAQIVAFGLGIMVLLLLSVVRGDMLQDWQRSLPADAPNHFLINVQPDQVDAIRTFFGENQLTAPRLYPMVRARWVAVNGRPVDPQDYQDLRAKRLATRAFNLSWASEPQSDNEIVAGRWWSATEQGRHLISFEQGLAETLGIALGDELTFEIAGAELAVEVANLRTVEWDSFQVNFFTVLPPGVLEGYPATYITSLYIDRADKALLGTLVRRFPNVTVIDVDALMSRVRSIIDRVAVAVEYVFLFTLLAGVIVLYAAIQATQDERRYEAAILRTLGARRAHLLRGVIAEFVTLGVLAGLLAGVAASALGFLLAEQVFNFDYRVNPWVVIIGMFGGALGVGLAGLLGTRAVLYAPPLHTLRAN